MFCCIESVVGAGRLSSAVGPGRWWSVRGVTIPPLRSSVSEQPLQTFNLNTIGSDIIVGTRDLLQLERLRIGDRLRLYRPGMLHQKTVELCLGRLGCLISSSR